MRLLYCALDQVVPGTVGGATHVRAVAEGLARLGHEVDVLTGEGDAGFPPSPPAASGAVRWHRLAAPGGRPHLRLVRAPAVRRMAAALAPDAVIERYHNFGGEGVLAARGIGVPAILEVNAPVVDHPGSAKARLDRLLVARPLQRWREHVCGLADLIVTPSARILPRRIPAARVLEIEWGADTAMFRPGAAGRVPFSRGDDETVAVFAGAFRAWHGAVHLAHAARELQDGGITSLHAVFVGDGPELARTREAAAPLARATFTGALPYAEMPACLAATDIGVAPFDAAAHAPLQLDFYWSPLKIFEYMASGLPVVAPQLPRLAQLVEHEREGLLYSPDEPGALAGALRALLDPETRRRLGQSGRTRAEREFSWAAHCDRLASAIAQCVAMPRGVRR